MKKVSPFYNEAVQQIKSAILESQLESAKAVNRQMLSLYYAIGRFVSENSREGTWGTSAINTISTQLRQELPGLRGFSSSNIKNMRLFYESWFPALNRSPTANDLENVENGPKSPKIPIFALLDINRQPLADDLDFSEFLSLSFTHHMEILLKTSSLKNPFFLLFATSFHNLYKFVNKVVVSRNDVFKGFVLFIVVTATIFIASRNYRLNFKPQVQSLFSRKFALTEFFICNHILLAVLQEPLLGITSA